MDMILASKIKSAAFRVLVKECSLEDIIFILRILQKGKKGGEPWKEMPAPVDEKEESSRELIGEAILLYRALKRVKSYEEAEKIVRKVIIASAVAQLKHLIPRIRKNKLKKLDKSGKELFFREVLDKFSNIDYEVVLSTDNELEFIINRCRLVELVQRAGHPELSNAFCAGDLLFFKEHQKEIIFEREETIGDACGACDFKFSIKD